MSNEQPTENLPVTLEKSDLGKVSASVDIAVMFPQAAVSLEPFTHRLRDKQCLEKLWQA